MSSHTRSKADLLLEGWRLGLLFYLGEQPYYISAPLKNTLLHPSNMWSDLFAILIADTVSQLEFKRVQIIFEES